MSYTKDLSNCGRRYRSARELRCITVEEAHRRSGLPVSEIETGKEGVSFQDHCRLAKLYRVTPCWLAGHDTTRDKEAMVNVLDRIVPQSLVDLYASVQSSAPISTCGECAWMRPDLGVQAHADVLDLLHWAWKYDDKPHRLYGKVVAMAKQYLTDADEVVEVRRLMEFCVEQCARGIGVGEMPPRRKQRRRQRRG